MDTILTHKKLLLNNTRSFLDVVKVGTYNKGLYSLGGIGTPLFSSVGWAFLMKGYVVL
jgi:hypothetical protein